MMCGFVMRNGALNARPKTCIIAKFGARVCTDVRLD